MKKTIISMSIIIGFGGISLLNASQDNIYVNVDSDIGKKIFQSKAAYDEYLKREREQDLKIKAINSIAEKNACEIVKLKKAIVKLIKERELNPNKNLSEIKEDKKRKVNTYPEKNNYSKLKSLAKAIGIKEVDNKQSCKTIVIKKIDTSNIESSYFKYKEPKMFKVIRNNVHVFKYPVIDSEKEDLVYNKNEVFQADMYTKAGWVHDINSGWIKGYKLYPNVKNLTSEDDIRKYSMRYKRIVKTKCKGEK